MPPTILHAPNVSHPTRVLVLVRHYLPGYRFGGPVRSVASLIERLGDEFEFSVVTSDRDQGDSRAYPEIRPCHWTQVGKARVIYLPRRHSRFAALARLLRQTPHDIIYLAGAFEPRFCLPVLLMRRLGLSNIGPVVLAPQGVFSAGALRVKRWKKRTFLAVTRRIGLFDDLTWHVSTEYEGQDVGRALGLASTVSSMFVALPNVPTSRSVMQWVSRPCSAVFVAADLAASDRNVSWPARQKSPDRLQVVFLSRICPKKNLDGALKILQGVAAPIDFHIYGPTEEETYWRKCQQEMQKLPANIQACYHGPILPAQVPAVMRSSDLFLFPTWGENFGHVILEALREGCPVLIANNTAFRDLEQKKAGWDVPLEDISRFQQILARCASMSAQEWLAWSEGSQKLATQVVLDPSCLDTYRTMFHRAASLERACRAAAA